VAASFAALRYFAARAVARFLYSSGTARSRTSTCQKLSVAQKYADLFAPRLCQVGCNPHTGSGISPVTLRQHFREELDRGPPKANSMVGQTLYQRATGGGDWRKASPLDQPCHADVLLSIANDEDGT
jgi:hypothetical protein